MYERFFGFSEPPFRLTANPRFLFLSPGHREALATLRYGLTTSLGITMVVGEPGTGKTTLLHAALRAEGGVIHRCAVLSNPTLTPADFFEILSEKFALGSVLGSKAKFLLALERDLLRQGDTPLVTSIVIDEAHSLTEELFEEIRLLANLETPTKKLVNVVLIGQPALADRLNDASLRQFKQRVVLRCALAPLDLQWTASYIAARLTVAGGVARDVFTKEAVRTIYEASDGIPRSIGVLCENALLAGYAAQKKPIDSAVITNVCRNLDLPIGGGHPSAAPSALDWKAPAVPSPDGAPRQPTLIAVGHADASVPGDGRRLLRFS
jgi:type II secretory pathway predicted ATPase ExeA